MRYMLQFSLLRCMQAIQNSKKLQKKILFRLGKYYCAYCQIFIFCYGQGPRNRVGQVGHGLPNIFRFYSVEKFLKKIVSYNGLPKIKLVPRPLHIRIYITKNIKEHYTSILRLE